MKAIFYILTGLHGIIHCFGFLKAYNIVEFDAIAQPISKILGSIWLIAFLLLAIALVLNITGVKYWWVIGIAAVLISQALIITVWQDAKFGTIPNIIILIVCILSFSDQNFSRMIASERASMLSIPMETQNLKLISDLPKPIQKWLNKAGVNDSMRVNNIYLTQKAKMKMKPEQENWYAAKAEQYFVTNPPSYNWSVRLKMNPFLPIRGRDKFEGGKGEMLIKLLSVIPIVDAKNNKKIDQGALQRFLAEIVWFPSAARNDYIEWEVVDEQSAKATMTFNGVTGSGIFYFDKEGNFERFSAMRYRGGGDDAELTEWIVEASEHKRISGFIIPTKLEATWKLEEQPWTWLKLEIINVEYNRDG